MRLLHPELNRRLVRTYFRSPIRKQPTIIQCGTSKGLNKGRYRSNCLGKGCKPHVHDQSRLALELAIKGGLLLIDEIENGLHHTVLEERHSLRSWKWREHSTCRCSPRHTAPNASERSAPGSEGSRSARDRVLRGSNASTVRSVQWASTTKCWKRPLTIGWRFDKWTEDLAIEQLKQVLVEGNDEVAPFRWHWPSIWGYPDIQVNPVCKSKYNIEVVP